MNDKKRLTIESEKQISALFKEMLALVDDMKQDHDFHYQKLYENIPAEYHPVINAANHFTSEKKAWIRKRILDIGNDSIRNMLSEIDNYTVSFIFKQ